jgi:hypothetical protein
MASLRRARTSGQDAPRDGLPAARRTLWRRSLTSRRRLKPVSSPGFCTELQPNLERRAQPTSAFTIGHALYRFLLVDDGLAPFPAILRASLVTSTMEPVTLGYIGSRRAKTGQIPKYVQRDHQLGPLGPLGWTVNCYGCHVCCLSGVSFVSDSVSRNTFDVKRSNE